jgi:hypothetical protein
MQMPGPEPTGATRRAGTVLAFSIHGTEHWWRHVTRNMGFERSFIVSDMARESDFVTTADFYVAYRRFRANAAGSSALLSQDEINDVIARCRVMRWYPRAKAVAMVLAMAEALDKVLEAAQPTLVVSFPIDRYGKDILERRAKARGIPYFEFTASPLPGKAMLLYRGMLVQRAAEPDAAAIETARHEIADPLFVPSYVQNLARFDRVRFLKTFGYFRLRGWGFRLLGALRRDPLNILYIDAQSSLGHKPVLADMAVTGLIDADWQARIAEVPKAQRVAIPLQLFPEASIDYWVRDPGLIAYEDVVVEAAAAFVAAGYHVLVKDHPLQFGFRQTGLLRRLKALGGVTIMPYDVSGNAMLAEVGTYFGLTGTLGLQAALIGLNAISAPNYYTNDRDFIVLADRAAVAAVPARLAAREHDGALEDRQRHIVAELLRGSFDGDFFSFKDFDPGSPSLAATRLGDALGAALDALGPNGEDWHRRTLRAVAR